MNGVNINDAEDCEVCNEDEWPCAFHEGVRHGFGLATKKAKAALDAALDDEDPQR